LTTGLYQLAFIVNEDKEYQMLCRMFWLLFFIDLDYFMA